MKRPHQAPAPEAPAPEAPAPAARVTIVCPLEFERRALARAGLGAICHLHRSGPGRAAITAWAATVDPPGPVVLAGLAGGLQPRAAPGSDPAAAEQAATSRARIVTRVHDETGKVCVLSASSASSATDETGEVCVLSASDETGEVCVLSASSASSASSAWADPPHARGARPCAVVSRPRIVVSAREKRALGEETGADLVDLESAAFAEAATTRGWSWGIVRGMSDDAETDLPAGVGSWTDDRGRARPLRVLADALRRPSTVLSLLRLRRDGEQALRDVAELLRAWLDGRSGDQSDR